jgi:hypothetical protein
MEKIDVQTCRSSVGAAPICAAPPAAGVGAPQADKLVQGGELSIASGAKLAGMPYALYLQHLGAIDYSLLEESAELSDELALLIE